MIIAITTFIGLIRAAINVPGFDLFFELLAKRCWVFGLDACESHLPAAITYLSSLLFKGCKLLIESQERVDHAVIVQAGLFKFLCFLSSLH